MKDKEKITITEKAVRKREDNETAFVDLLNQEIKEFAEWYTISYVELCKAIDKIAKQFGVEEEE